MHSGLRQTEYKTVGDAALRLAVILLAVFLIIAGSTAVVQAQTEDSIIQVSIPYSGIGPRQYITVDYSDDWLLQPDNEYNHKLMQLSFALAAAGFRDKQQRLTEKDANILKFFSRTGFTNTQTDDFNRETSESTVASAIASKRIGDATIIAVSVSGNNYQNEWLSNLTVNSEERAHGFNAAADKVFERIKEYIRSNQLSGELRLWVSGYSRAAAISNILAADATDSGLFAAVYGYTIATPRTTKEKDAARYDNIFNIINPFDPVPLVPFPEWGYIRYGQDLFLPSQETDSTYAGKKVHVDELCMETKGHALHYNPQVNAQIHTILDYSLFYISSSNSYKETFQTGILDIWKNKNFGQLFSSIADKILKLPDITSYQLSEFYSMLDYLMQITYTNFRAQVFHIGNSNWEPQLSLKENIMHEHFDEVYRFWLFSSDDPADIFQNDPRYIHYTVLGEVDAEIFDEDLAFIARINHNGTVSTDPAENLLGTEKVSPIKLFAMRQDKQTTIFMPADQEFLILLTSLKEQDVRSSYVEYSAKNIRGDIQYILSEHVSDNETLLGAISPASIGELTDEELLKYGFTRIEPWSKEVVYSPSSIMRVENTGIFHPTPRFLLTLILLFLLLMLYFLVMSSLGTGSLIKKGVNKVRTYRAEKRELQAENVQDDCSTGGKE